MSRLVGYYTRHGFRTTVRRVSLAAKRALFSSRMVLFYYDLAASALPPEVLMSSLGVERKRRQSELRAQEMSEMTRFWNPKLARRNITERFEHGASLWMIKSEGQLAGYGWSLKGQTVEPHYFRLGPDDVHLFDFHVFPQYRGRGLNPLLVRHILNNLAIEAKGRAFIEAAEWNLPQLSSLRRTPFHSFGSARKFRFFRYTVVLWDMDETVEQEQGNELTGASSAAGGKGSSIPNLRA